MNSVQIIPAIIPQSIEHLKSQLSLMKGLAPRMQIDVIDGVFAPTPSWPYDNKKSTEQFLRIVQGDEGLPFWQDFQFEIDMMVTSPESHIQNWIKIGASALIIHYTSTDDHSSILAKIKEAGLEAGIAILPSSPVEDIMDLVEEFDFIQFMGSDNIGHHGEELDDFVYEKISDLREEFPEATIAVDMGVNFETAPKLIEAGANKLVSGSTVFNASSIEEAISRLASSH